MPGVGFKNKSTCVGSLGLHKKNSCPISLNDFKRQLMSYCVYNVAVSANSLIERV